MKKEMAISQFKTNCLEILKNLESSNSSIIITKRSKPIATVSSIMTSKQSIFGMLKNKAEIKSNLIAYFDEEWEADK